MKPQLLVVRGTLGAGKTTLALRLAELLSWPVLHREVFRDNIAATLGVDSLEPGGNAAKEAVGDFYTHVRERLRAGTSVIADSTFPSGVCEPDLTPLMEIADVGALTCTVPRDIVRARCHERPNSGPLMAVLGRRDESMWRRFEESLNCEIPQRFVDTTDTYVPSIETLTNWIKLHFPMECA